jgi:hypothetical protein
VGDRRQTRADRFARQRLEAVGRGKTYHKGSTTRGTRRRAVGREREEGQEKVCSGFGNGCNDESTKFRGYCSAGIARSPAPDLAIRREEL